MKKTIKISTVILFTLFNTVSFSQTHEDLDKSFYAYKTYEDFQNDKGEFLGMYTSYIWSDLFANNKIILTENSETKKVNVNKFWGFRIGDFLFKLNNSSPKIPLFVTDIKGKVFYVDGYIYLNYLANGSASSFRTKDAVFYSDDLESKIYKIDKLISKEKDNQTYDKLVKCLKKAKKRHGYQAQFNGYTKCIEEFTIE